jgi:hypothetical protein
VSAFAPRSIEGDRVARPFDAGHHSIHLRRLRLLQLIRPAPTLAASRGNSPRPAQKWGGPRRPRPLPSLTRQLPQKAARGHTASLPLWGKVRMGEPTPSVASRELPQRGARHGSLKRQIRASRSTGRGRLTGHQHLPIDSLSRRERDGVRDHACHPRRPNSASGPPSRIAAREWILILFVRFVS